MPSSPESLNSTSSKPHKMTKKLLKFSLLLILVLTLSNTVMAAAPIDPSLRPINVPFDLNYANNNASSNTIIVLNILAGALLYFAGPIAIIMIAFSGFQIVTGGAESEKLDEGKKSLTWAIIGLLAIILSYSIVRIALAIIIDSGQAVNIN